MSPNRRGRWRDRVRARFSHGILRRRLVEAIAVATVSGAATALVAVYAGSDGESAAALAIGVAMLVLLVIAPALLMTLDVVSDFVRLSSVDAALLGGLEWHPDLSVVGIEMPPIVTEGDPFQRVAITLEYKPLVTSYRGTLRGEARLVASPAVVSFARDEPDVPADDFSFELSPDAPRQTITFCVEREPAALACLAGAETQRALASDGAVSSRLQLDITSDWDLRTVPGTPVSRTANLRLGLLHLHLLARAEWVDRMIRAGFITVLPNGLAFNPVITSDRAYGIGTNVVIAGRRWNDALARNEPEARLLLQVAARLLALQVVSEPDPDILEYREDEALPDPPAALSQGHPGPNTAPAPPEAARPAAPNSVAHAIAADVDCEPLRKQLAIATRDAFSEMRRSGEFTAPVPTTDHRPHSYEVRVQDTGRSTSRLERGTPELSLIGLAEEADSRHLLVATSPTPRHNVTLPPVRSLDDVIDQTGAELIAYEQIPEYFPACRSIQESDSLAAGTAVGSPGDTSHDESAGATAGSSAAATPPSSAMGCDEIDAALEEIHAVFVRSHVVTTGFYIQPQPVIKHHWLDLRACSESIHASGLSDLVRSVVTSAVAAVARTHRSSGIRVYNCCAPGGDTSDHRFAPLRELSDTDDVVGVRYEASTRRWLGVTDGDGDAFVISALSNDQRAFGDLLNSVARRDRPATFVPFFGPIEPTAETLAGLAGSATVHVLPLLVWDASSSTYVPSTRAPRYQGLWTVLRRHEDAGVKGDADAVR